ncbi:NAD-P-binding protein [Amylostereum chailletii]|nr:NAD-P-binding protein [Amylostereum chailletii]
MSQTFIGADEIEPFSAKHDIYPFIDPKPFWSAQTYKGQVVLITGASRGIGLTTALFYARAGAAVVLVARKQATLDESKDSILKEVPTAQVLTLPADVSNHEDAAHAVKTTVDLFGRLDILICNAAVITPMTHLLADKDALAWWFTQEVNVRGVFNFVHAAIPELLKTTGQIIIVSSSAAHVRIPNASDYHLSKHTVDRLAELVAIEYPTIKTYAVHPGVIETQLNKESVSPVTLADTLELPAATFLWLTARKAEWLSGRFIAAPWDLEEVLKYQDIIIKNNLLVTKLAVRLRDA